MFQIWNTSLFSKLTFHLYSQLLRLIKNLIFTHTLMSEQSGILHTEIMQYYNQALEWVSFLSITLIIERVSFSFFLLYSLWKSLFFHPKLLLKLNIHSLHSISRMMLFTLDQVWQTFLRPCAPEMPNILDSRHAKQYSF